MLAILSFLGWRARPIARLRADVPSLLLRDDLQRFGVDTSLLLRSEDGSTPIVVERIYELEDGSRSHSFSLRCPCGAHLPSYKAVRARDAAHIAADLGAQEVFFFDRASRGTLSLAASARDSGGLVVFEPSGVGVPRLFREAWSMSHVVKYSNERFPNMGARIDASLRREVLLEVETLGASGLRYRSRAASGMNVQWKSLKVIASPILRDAAGAGDWCTAGLLHKVGSRGRAGFARVDDDVIFRALRFGQALATWACAFESARGGMYQVTRRQFDRQIRRLLRGASFRVRAEVCEDAPEEVEGLCPTCEGLVAMLSSGRQRDTSVPHFPQQV